MLGLGYLDCRMMVLGTRLHMAKTKIGSEMSYASHVASVKTDNIKNVIKDKAKSIKKVKIEVSVQESTDVDTEEKVDTSTVTESSEETKEKVTKDIVEEEKVDTSTTIENNTQYGPDFTPLQGVFYDPEVGNFSSEEHEKEPKLVYMQSDGSTVNVVTGTDDDIIGDNARPVTEEDVEIALKKIKENQQPKEKAKNNK